MPNSSSIGVKVILEVHSYKSSLKVGFFKASVDNYKIKLDIQCKGQLPNWIESTKDLNRKIGLCSCLKIFRCHL